MYNCNGHTSNRHVSLSGLRIAEKSLYQISQRAKFCHSLNLCGYIEIDGVVQVCLRAEFDPFALVEIVLMYLKEEKGPISLNIVDGEPGLLSHLHW